MLKLITNHILILHLVFFKTRCKIILLILCLFSISISASINDLNDINNNTLSSSIVTTEKNIISNDENPNHSENSLNNNNVVGAQGEIFILNGATLYNEGSLNNVKITKISHKQTVKKIIKQKESKKVLHKKTFKIENKLLNFEIKPSQNSNEIFIKGKVKIVCAQNNNDQSPVKAILSKKKYTSTFVTECRNKKITYQRPLTITYYFLGKYSIRPPTSLGI